VVKLQPVEGDGRVEGGVLTSAKSIAQKCLGAELRLLLRRV